MPSTRHIYIAQTQPGFEAIAATEIAQRLDSAHILDVRPVADKNGMVRFAYAGDPRDPLTLRTVEDIFVAAACLSSLLAHLHFRYTRCSF